MDRFSKSIACSNFSIEVRGGLIADQLKENERSEKKRLREFLAGRRLVDSLLQEMGTATMFPLAKSDRGLPIWPTGVVGSISHRHNWVVATAAIPSQSCLLGIDVESLFSHSQAEKIANRICTQNEKEKIFEESSEKFAEKVTFIFSAKESFYKGFFALYGKSLTWKQVEVEWSSETELRLQGKIPGEKIQFAHGYIFTWDTYCMTLVYALPSV